MRCSSLRPALIWPKSRRFVTVAAGEPKTGWLSTLKASTSSLTARFSLIGNSRWTDVSDPSSSGPCRKLRGALPSVPIAGVSKAQGLNHWVRVSVGPAGGTQLGLPAMGPL